MCATNDGFKIQDLELRGPGDIEGTKQSCTMNFKLASLIKRQRSFKHRKISCGRQNIKTTMKIFLFQKKKCTTEKSTQDSKKGRTVWSKISAYFSAKYISHVLRVDLVYFYS